jgi:hypothetical protein
VSVRNPKSSVDILEHVTAGGVDVYKVPPRAVRELSRESILGGAVDADVESRTRPLERAHDRRPARRKKP